MAIYLSAQTNGLSRADVNHAVANAYSTSAVGNEPTRILVTGPDLKGNLIEVYGIIRPEDFFIIHAIPARPAVIDMLKTINWAPDTEPHLPPGGDDVPTAEDNGYSVDEIELTDEVVDKVVRDAESGHSVEILKRRIRPRRPAPLPIGDAIWVHWDASLRDAVEIAADQAGISVGELARRAVREFVS